MQFVYPSFLWALTALSIPVIIHLFHFRRYKRVLFSDVRFLKQLQEQNKSKQKVKDWLILLSRLLALACLVFAFAQPFIPLGSGNRVSGQKVIAIYVDNSFSMLAQGEEGTLLEVAKAKARAIVNAYGSSDQFQVLTNQATGAEQRLLTLTEAMDKIDAIAPSVARMGIDAIKIKQAHAFQQASGYRAAYYISDFQKNQFSGIKADEDSLKHVFYVPVQAATTPNISIDSIYFSSPQVKPNTPFVAKIKLTNHGEETVEGLVVKVQLNGTQKALVNATLGAKEQVELEVNLTCQTNAWQKGEVVITDHPITFDDHLYFTFQPSIKNTILVIGDAPNAYIDAVFANDSYYQLNNVNRSTINYQTLSSYQLVVLNEPTEISSGLEAELDKYLEQGGQLLLIPSSSRAETLNSFLIKYNLPTYGGLVRQQLKVNHINTKHPIFSNVFSALKQQTDLPWVASYFPLVTASKTNGKSLVELNNGASVLWQAKVKKGSVVQLAFPLNESSSGFPKHSLVVPMLLNMAMGVQKQQQLYAVLGEQGWVLAPTKVSGSDQLLLVKGSKQEFTTEASQWQQNQVVPTELITTEGWFDVAIKQGKTPLFTFAYNNNREESSMEFWKDTDLSDASKAEVKNLSAEVLGAQLSMELSGKVLWRWFILATLLFIACEILLIRLLK